MREWVEWQKKLVPEALDTMGRRYRILQYVRVMQPIGRRTLAQHLQFTERVLRNEVSFLKNQGLLHISTSGMELTDEAYDLLDELEESMKAAFGLSALEQKLADKLQIPEVIVLADDSDEQSWVKRELGRACIDIMGSRLAPGDVVAVAGGTTLASIAEMMVPNDVFSSITFVPARGGLGEDVEIQSNTIVSQMAKRARANYRLLHVPDQLSEETRDSLQLEPGIKELLELIRRPRMVVHGIGEAETMALRRRTEETAVDELKKQEAVAEAFGYYFDKDGRIVHKEQTTGLQLDDLTEEQTVITVAGGASKAEAIAAYMRYRPSDLLITDEGAAQAVLNYASAGSF
ncbi:sugar-binding transcriptional regulator [Salsuginibacillus halophilus]|nr:sugar-binding domain-containing protein [Salsuginibacillus halophilus]